MSIVRYTNKKTGTVSLYESTSHYDPVLKQSRPIRKYLGIEDPITGELIPSSGKNGSRNRKTATSVDAANLQKIISEQKLLNEELKKECAEKDRIINQLESKVSLLQSDLEKLYDTIGRMLKSKVLSED